MDQRARTALIAAVEKHVMLFNACVTSGDWAPFVDTFTDDALLTLTNVPAEPLRGRDRIAEMYAARPPTQTMKMIEATPIDDHTVRVRFAWHSARPSTMAVSWRDDRVCAVELTL